MRTASSADSLACRVRKSLSRSRCMRAPPVASGCPKETRSGLFLAVPILIIVVVAVLVVVVVLVQIVVVVELVVFLAQPHGALLSRTRRGQVGGDRNRATRGLARIGRTTAPTAREVVPFVR